MIQHNAYPDEAMASEACAHHIIARMEEALSGQEFVTLAISGGNTPVQLFHRLAASKFDWNKVHLFWVDERLVPPSNPQSNYKLADEHLIAPARIPRRNVHRICGELAPEHAAKRYTDDIREFFGLADGEMPHFDVIHRGLGEDCHTASLFPGQPLIEDREGIAAAVYVEKLTQWRVTLLPGPLLATKHTVILVTGAKKAGAVRSVLREPYDPLQYPAQIVSHHGRGVAWFMDEPAASLLD